MKERNKVTSVNEQYLFHGTDASLIDAICEQNFDWRMCGVHGTSYGKGTYHCSNVTNIQSYILALGHLTRTRGSSGFQNSEKQSSVSDHYRSLLVSGSYFARDASRSDCYVQVKSGQHRIMFVALVLVGEHANGSSSFVRPPPKGNGKTLYDSCVDSQSDPSIYVVFEKQQIYPEYLIDYS